MKFSQSHATYLRDINVPGQKCCLHSLTLQNTTDTKQLNYLYLFVPTISNNYKRMIH
jgi:hypothetical protein